MRRQDRLPSFLQALGANIASWREQDEYRLGRRPASASASTALYEMSQQALPSIDG